MTPEQTDQHPAIARHIAAGRRFDAAGIGSFTLDAGDGPAVVCMHGVPVSSYLYRRVVPALAQRGLRGIAFDLPGLGLAERPDDFDYSWTGLGRFATAAVDAMELDRFHLVVHDIGGPVGFEVAAALRERVASLTILNTLVDVASFRKPWVMRPFEIPVIGEMWLATMMPATFRPLMALVGIGNMAAVPREEIAAHVHLLKRGDGGRAFLKIMRSFETTADKQAVYAKTLRDVPYPVQIVWGAQDTALPMKRYGEQAKAATGLDHIATVDAKHFLQEDQPEAVADHIAALVNRAGAAQRA